MLQSYKKKKNGQMKTNAAGVMTNQRTNVAKGFNLHQCENVTFRREGGGRGNHLTDWENVQNWQSWQSWKCEWGEQRRCLLRGRTASQTSSPECCREAGNEVTPETG